jgi:hypothetical protein
MKQGINVNSHVEAYANVQTCTKEFKQREKKIPVQKTRKRFLLCAASLRTSKTTLEKP